MTSPDTYTSTAALTMRLLKDQVFKHKKRLFLAVSCMVMAALATAANAWLMQPVLDDIFLKKDQSMLTFIPLVVLLLALIKGAASFGQLVHIKYVGQRVVTDMQLTLYAHLLKSDIALFDAESSGRLISRFSNDIQIIRKNLINILTGVAKESVTLVFLIGVMFYQSLELALIAFIVFPVAVYPTIRLGKRMRKISSGTQEELGQYTVKLDDTFQGIRIVKAYGREEDEAQRAKSVVERIFGYYVKAARTESAASPIMESLAGLAIAGVIWYGGYKVLNGITTPGAFFSFVTAMVMAYKPLKSMTGLNANAQEGLAAVARYYAMIDKAPTIVDAVDAKTLSPANASIRFNDVSFSYDGKKSALSHMTLDVPSGKKVALVGSSGSGKTTIMNLLLRFYDPQDGSITIGGDDIRQVTLSSLRANIAVVTQDPLLFDDTVRANIGYGRFFATDEQIIDAARQAAAHDFISELPEGYDTVIGQRGLRLSGGQRQRIAIARAMLRDAPILLLDEATSALDNVSEEQVQKALEKLMKDRTTIIIAHRLSTIIHADIICVVSHGRVVEQGTHEMLLAKGGEYKKLYDRQFTEADASAA